MRVFTDYHHGDLYYSLHRLFVERLGWELYRPIGLDWFHNGYWKIAEPYGNAMDTVNQYLAIGSGEFDSLSNLNGGALLVQDLPTTPPFFLVGDPIHDYSHRCVTFDQFRAMKFDLIVSCYGPPHDHAFDDLQRKYQPKAKRLCQMGNVFQDTHVQHVLHSVPWTRAHHHEAFHYHQEIDPKFFYYTEPEDWLRPHIYSFVNLLPSRLIYEAHKAMMPEVDFAAFGADCPDGYLKLGVKDIAPLMREATLGWHIKPHDGFGHTAMGWMASGRAVITMMEDVREYGYDAPALFIPGETCLDASVANMGKGTIAGAIREWLQPEVAYEKGLNARKRFELICNYDEEEKQIRTFLERLLS